MQRRGGRPTRARELRRFLRGHARVLLACALVGVMLVAALAFVLDGYLLGLAHGLAGTALVVAIWLLFWMRDGARWHRAGYGGENATRDVLRAAGVRGHIVGWVDNLETADGGVDHLVVTSGAVLAIDSAWRGRRLSPHMLEADVHAAASSGRRATSILRSLHRREAVTAVVVVWGGSRELLGRNRTIQGVHVVAGPRLRGWLRDLARHGPGRADEASALLSDLRAFGERARPARPPPAAITSPRGVAG